MCGKFNIKVDKNISKNKLIDKIVNDYKPVNTNGINYILNGKNIKKHIISIYKIEGVGEVFFSIKNLTSLLLVNNTIFSNLDDFLEEYTDVYNQFKNVNIKLMRWWKSIHFITNIEHL